jgi:hypothetical protein
MQKLTRQIQDEEGYFLIVATLLLLALLTVIGIAASNTARTEVQVAGNDLTYQRNLYLAEGAAMEAIDRLQNDDSPRALGFVVPGLKVIDDNNFVDHWDGEAQSATFDGSGETRFVAGYEGTPPGFSLGMGQPKVHGFAIYGRTERQGVTTIKIGYRKAF